MPQTATTQDFDWGNTQPLASAQPTVAAQPAVSAQPKPALTPQQQSETHATFDWGNTQPIGGDQEKPEDDTGVLASLKRNTVGAASGLYHAVMDEATPEEQQHFTDLAAKYKAHGANVPDDAGTNPSTASLAWYRLFERPADELNAKGGRDLANTDKGPLGTSEKVAGTAEKGLSYVPLMGPLIAGIGERAGKGDISGAATDAAFLYAADKAPEAFKVAKSQWQAARDIGLIDKTYDQFTKAVPPTKSTPYTPPDLQRARLYMEKEHGISPITDIESARDAADTAIEKIENKISEDYVGSVPNEPITTNVLADVKRSLATNARGDAFVQAGLKELEGLNLENPTVKEADAIRRQLNLENKPILKQNDYNIAAARASSPGFAAREAAAESLRNGLYDKLETQVTNPGAVRSLRLDEGSLLRVRDAIQNQILNGDKVVASTNNPGILKRTTATLVKGTSTAVGAAKAGPAGAVLGSEVGSELAEGIKGKGMTRSQLMEQAFKTPTSSFLGYPKVNLRAAPEVTPKGQTAIPNIGPLFENETPYPEHAAMAKPQTQLLFLQSEVRPLQAVLADPLATTIQKAEAAHRLSQLPLQDLQNVSAESEPSGAVPESIQRSRAVARGIPAPDLAKQAGLVFKGELAPGTGVFQFEDPKYPGKTMAVKAKDLSTAEALRSRMKAKLSEFN